MSADDAAKGVPSNSAAERQGAHENQGTLESPNRYPIVRRKAHAFLKFIFSHRMIPLLKGNFTATHISGLRH